MGVRRSDASRGLSEPRESWIEDLLKKALHNRKVDHAETTVIEHRPLATPGGCLSKADT
jgi:hypothetical protein